MVNRLKFDILTFLNVCVCTCVCMHVCVCVCVCVYLLVQHSSSNLYQGCGQVVRVSRFSVTNLLQQNLGAVVNHLPDQSKAGLPTGVRG